MHRNQFDNKYANFKIAKNEMERKWRVYEEEKELMEALEALANRTRAWGQLQPGSPISSGSVPSDSYYLGGSFTVAFPSITTRIAPLTSSGNLDALFATGSGFDAQPAAMAAQSDNKVVVGGYFTTYQGVTQNRIARFNTDGSLDSSFVTGSGFGSNISDLTIQPDGKILVVGAFTTYK